MADQANEVVTAENNVQENGATAPEAAEKPTDLSSKGGAAAVPEEVKPDEASRDSAVDDENSKSSFEEGDDDTVEKSGDEYADDDKAENGNEDSTDAPPAVVDGQPDTNGNDRKRVSDAHEEGDEADIPSAKKAKADDEAVTVEGDVQAVAE